MGYGEARPADVKSQMKEYDISARLTFSNSLLRPEHLADSECNRLCRLFESQKNGIIITSDLLLDFIRKNYPSFYFVSSTTKVLTAFSDFRKELDRREFSYVVPDFRLNRRFEDLKALTSEEKDKTEFLVNECCSFACPDRKACYEAVSRLALGGWLCRKRSSARPTREGKRPGENIAQRKRKIPWKCVKLRP